MEIQTLIDQIVDQVKTVKGVSAIALGGSRARGTHTPQSDIDLCLYYDPKNSLDLNALNRIASGLDDRHAPGLLTPLGGWGPWINGGGWLTIHSQPVDFLYRDLSKVAAVIQACHAGQVEIAYQPGHPFGFLSSIYMAEIALCRLLWDADGKVPELKKKTQPYPAALKKALIAKFAWEVDFSLEIAKKSIERADVSYAAGSCFRSAACMLLVLFALNGQYWLNEKGALALANAFQKCPADFQERIEEAFASLAPKSDSLQQAISVLEGVAQDVDRLVKSDADRDQQGL
jgi:hypothetical protein